jgi:hypothetical protein
MEWDDEYRPQFSLHNVSYVKYFRRLNDYDASIFSILVLVLLNLFTIFFFAEGKLALPNKFSDGAGSDRNTVNHDTVRWEITVRGCL